MLRVSVVVPTRDRSNDLTELLTTVLNQSKLPLEAIIIDDSPILSARQITYSFSSKFESVNCKLKYVNGRGDGLSAARNLGLEISEGDAILFVDDDTLLGQNVVDNLTKFLNNNPAALGVQPKIVLLASVMIKGGLAGKFENAIYKGLMLSYHKENSLRVRRSGMSVFPNSLTRTILAQRLSGCCCCYRREILNKSSFDTKLKRWGYMEDLDFSYRAYRSNPKSLYAIPNAKIIHKVSREARLPTRLSIYMKTIYWFYVFFKVIFENSILNLMAFIWALTGNLVAVTGGLVIKRKPKREWWSLIYLLGSYATAFRNLKNIWIGKLEFFNKNLNK